MRQHAYPPALARYVQQHWPAERQLSLSLEHLDEALAAAFQASLTTEESRATRFRLLLTGPDQLPPEGTPGQGVLRLSLRRPRPLNADELRRLAPAVPFEMALIGAHAVADELRIWGVAHSGPAWLAPTWGGRSVVPNWSYDPIVHVTAPGQVAVRCAGKLIGAIERGALVDATLDVFDSRWLPAMFAREREDIRAAHAATQAGVASPTAVEHSLVGRVGQHMLRRTIQLVRGAHHGGLLLAVNVDDGATLPGGVRLKYAFQPDEPSERYRTLLLRILAAVAASSGKATVGWADFASSEAPQFAELEAEVFELSHIIANLSAIDGAVVLDKRFRLLGFGAEVSAELPTPERVYRALDAEGRYREPSDVQNVGTRHRAAYRFVNDHPAGLAVVVSQDGGVSIVANHGGEVVFWEQSVSP